MAFFKTAIEKHQAQLDEEFLYSHVANEIANNKVSRGLWTKSLVSTGGDEKKAEIQYIKLRLDMLKAENKAIGEVVKRLQTIKTAHEVVSNSTQRASCKYCGGFNVATRYDTKAPHWCFDCQKHL